MSGSYSRLAEIRDYWMPRDLDARAEVRVTDIDAILRELARLTGQRDALLEALKSLMLRIHTDFESTTGWAIIEQEMAHEAIKLVEGEKE